MWTWIGLAGMYAVLVVSGCGGIMRGGRCSRRRWRWFRCEDWTMTTLLCLRESRNRRTTVWMKTIVARRIPRTKRMWKVAVISVEVVARTTSNLTVSARTHLKIKLKTYTSPPPHSIATQQAHKARTDYSPPPPQIAFSLYPYDHSSAKTAKTAKTASTLPSASPHSYATHTPPNSDRSDPDDPAPPPREC